jgi:hypothetical protein
VTGSLGLYRWWRSGGPPATGSGAVASSRYRGAPKGLDFVCQHPGAANRSGGRQRRAPATSGAGTAQASAVRGEARCGAARALALACWARMPKLGGGLAVQAMAVGG